MLDADLVKQCVGIKCAKHFIDTASDALNKQYYYRVIGLANVSFQVHSDLPESNAESSALIGKALYYLGNYSDSQMWFKMALHYINKHLQNINIIFLRWTTCNHLLMSGDIFNVFCYGYLIKDFMSLSTIQTIKELHTEYYFNKETEVIILSTETSVTEQTHSYIWSLADKYIATRLHMYWFAATNIVYESAREHSFFFKVVDKTVGCISWLYIILYGCSLIVIFITAEIMSSCCTEQIQCCCSCFNFCILTITLITTAMFLFILGLDWLY